MFKRLSKSRRHSADEVTITSDLSLGLSKENRHILTGASILTRTPTRTPKCTRRNCTDAITMQTIITNHQQFREEFSSNVKTETDYQMVTAVPAFIVEHEPEKQQSRGSSLGLWGRRMSKKIDSFRRAGSRETLCLDKTETTNSDAINNNKKVDKRNPGNLHRSPSPFKSFFIRMGSTGMLNSKTIRRSSCIEDRLKTSEKENLFRSCSTSQLNTSPTYVKGDDPSEGIDLQISQAQKDKTLSCDNLSAQQDEDSNRDDLSFLSLGATSNYIDSTIRKSNSCDFKENRKTNFPYAFLRSRLSVLPEERNSYPAKDERLFKTTSEEHFPTLKIEESYNITTTLGRRRPRSTNNTEIISKNCYTRFDNDRYSLICAEDYYNGCEKSPTEEEGSMTILRHHRRNSAPGCGSEQRLSTHYVSSNESGYDSDGPRGDALVGVSEIEGLKCSSDTSSVIDSECQEQDTIKDPSNHEDIEGLRWHQSNSGRILPSINQTSSESSQFQLSTKLQQDKTRFLNDIVQPVKRIRRCRMVQLRKNDPKENLGIRLAQQKLQEIRYIVVKLENDGIAHRDGRLRLGDEIVQVEGKELKTLQTLEEVQEFLKSFTGNEVRLMTAYEETVPQVYPTEYEPVKNKISDSSSVSRSSKDQKDKICSLESISEAQHYITKHIAKFEKGYGKPSLGFSVVGGRDSPKGEMGIFVRRIFPGGQADVSKSLLQGDEILSINGKVLKGYTHQEVIELFKAVREGPVELNVIRRHRYLKNGLKSTPYRRNNNNNK